MIALIVSPTWKIAHTSSPHMTLKESKDHKAFKKFIMTSDELESESVREQINACDGVVVDYNNSYAMDFYKNGPKFLIWGDEHCHTQAEVDGTEALHSKYDYVLVGTPQASQKTPPYLYVNEATLSKRLYFPHMVPDERPEAPSWEARLQRAVLPSNVCPHVYRFRWHCGQLSKDGAPIDLLPHFQKVRSEFLKHIGTYQYAVTCNSHKWLNYTVAKYFEMPYMGAVTVATPLHENEAKRLGFEHGKNIVFTVDPHDVGRVMDGSFVVDRPGISKAGTELMTRYHTATKRLDYLEKLVARARAGKVTAMDSFDIFAEVKGAH